MHHLPRKTLTFLIVFIVFLFVLFSYFFSSSRADRITSNEEYIASLKEASRGKRLAGATDLQPIIATDQGRKASGPTNIFEELLFQLKAVFKAR